MLSKLDVMRRRGSMRKRRRTKDGEPAPVSSP